MPLRQQGRQAEFVNLPGRDPVLTTHHPPPGQLLGDPERFPLDGLGQLPLQTGRHQGIAAHPQQWASQLLGQGARHHHREAGAREAPWPRRHGKALQLGPTLGGEELLNPGNQTVGQPPSIGMNPQQRPCSRPLRIVKRDAETI